MNNNPNPKAEEMIKRLYEGTSIFDEFDPLIDVCPPPKATSFTDINFDEIFDDTPDENDKQNKKKP